MYLLQNLFAWLSLFGWIHARASTHILKSDPSFKVIPIQHIIEDIEQTLLITKRTFADVREYIKQWVLSHFHIGKC